MSFSQFNICWWIRNQQNVTWINILFIPNERELIHYLLSSSIKSITSLHKIKTLSAANFLQFLEFKNKHILTYILNMAFSVKPIKQAAHAITKAVKPMYKWIGIMAALRLAGKPGNRKAKNPNTYWKPKKKDISLDKCTSFLNLV